MGVVASVFGLALLLGMFGVTASVGPRTHHRPANVASAQRRKSTVLWTAHRVDHDIVEGRDRMTSASGT